MLSSLTIQNKLKAIDEIARLLGFVKEYADPEIERQTPHVITFKDCDGKTRISNDPSQF